MASTYLTRTQSTATSDKIGTFSAWIKACDSNFAIFSGHTDTNNRIALYLNETLRIYGAIGGSQSVYFITNRVFRDSSAWYHIVVAWDTSQGTDTNRFKIYVNGVQETSFSTAAYPSVDADVYWNKGTTSIVGARFISAVVNYFSGSMANVEFVDGQQLTPAYFGSTDSTTGIWTPQASSTISSYGTNGFKLKMDTTSPGADTSGKGNTFTASGTPTLTQGSPSNVWANMATPTWYDGTIANGGNTVSTNQSNYRYQTSSIGVTKGKWYWEVKLSTAADYALMGITCDPNPTNTTSNWILGSGASDYSVVYNTAGGNGNKYNNAGTSPTNTPGAFMGGFAAGNIIMFALDCDNNTLKIGTNNSWSNGSGSTNQTFSNTTPISITDPTATNTGFYFASVGDYGGGTSVFQFNFGEGFFATTAAGTQADDNGQGLFAYDVPAGYYALNTKNLEAYG